MKKIIILISFLSIQLSYSALPPKYQNTKDLNVMVKFIEAHPKVSSTLESINFKSFTVTFNHGCKAYFTREPRKKPKGWVGPASPLTFKKATCDID